MITHCMLDLETWGTQPGCALRSIGAVMFDPMSRKLGSRFYANINLTSCDSFGLFVDPSTADWWARQSDAAKVFDNQLDLDYVVKGFKWWWKKQGAKHVWAHGSVFDVPIWDEACRAVKETPPWAYNHVLDTRTVFWLTGYGTTRETFVGVKHNALDDAVHQAKCVQIGLEKWDTRSIDRG